MVGGHAFAVREHPQHRILRRMFSCDASSCLFFFFFSSRRRHTRLQGGLEFRRVLFRSVCVALSSTPEALSAGYASKMAESARTRPLQASSSSGVGRMSNIFLSGSALAKSSSGWLTETFFSAARLREMASTADLYALSVSSHKNRRITS